MRFYRSPDSYVTDTVNIGVTNHETDSFELNHKDIRSSFAVLGRKNHQVLFRLTLIQYNDR